MNPRQTAFYFIYVAWVIKDDWEGWVMQNLNKKTVQDETKGREKGRGVEK